MFSDVINGIFSLAIGNTLGLPHEFCSKKYLIQYPVIDMDKFKTHNQPKGTLGSDDSIFNNCNR